MDFREVIIALIVFAIIYGIFLAWKIFKLTPGQKKRTTTRRANVHHEPSFNPNTAHRRDPSFSSSAQNPRSTSKNFYLDDDDDDNVLDLGDPRVFQEQRARTFHERAQAFQERRRGNPDTRPWPRTERRAQPQQTPSQTQARSSTQQRQNSYAYEPPELNLQPSHLSARIDSIEQQMVLIRQSILDLRTSFANFTENTNQELERLRNTQTVSPMYSEAMRLAGVGYNAQEVAQRCGISLSEAELVSSLARSQREGQHGE